MSERFHEWLLDKAKAGTVFTVDQLTWLGLIRDHSATSLSIEPDDFDYTPFSQQGGLGKAHQLLPSAPSNTPASAELRLTFPGWTHRLHPAFPGRIDAEGNWHHSVAP